MKTIPSSSEPAPDQPTESRQHLADLYPQAKSFEQRQADNIARSKLFQQRRPKHPAWSISARLYILSLSVVAMFLIVPGLTQVGMTGVFLSFLLLLIAAGTWYGSLSKIAAQLYAADIRLLALAATLLPSTAPLLIVLLRDAAQRGVGAEFNGLLFTIFSIVHFACSYIVVATLLSTKLSGGAKAVRLALTITLGVTAAFFAMTQL